MKPDWDKLMKQFKDHATILVADVDCTAGGKELCNTVGVKGYPTLKYGDPNALEAYEGGRTLADLKKFAAGLKPGCSPANIDLCDDAEKAEIEKVQALSDEELAESIKTGESEMEAAEKNFKEELEKLQATYKKLSDDKDAKIAAIKDAGLGLKKSVQAARKKAAKDAKKAAKKAKKDEL